MKNYIKILFAAWLVLFLWPVLTQAQVLDKVEVRAVVYGKNGVKLRQATVESSRDNAKTSTDTAGRFVLEASRGSDLLVTAEGYNSTFVKAGPGLDQITLEASDQLLQVAFRQVNRRDILGGVSTIDQQSLIQKSYNLSPLEGAEALVNGFNGNIWGFDSYLVLIDGAPREIGSVQQTEIDHVTFLKSAAAVALYGSRAAKGVVYITTKRGGIHNQTINVRANAGIYVPKSYPQYLGSAEYMTLYNEARQNDGLPAQYTPETIYNHASGTSPYRYPNVDYYSSEYLKKIYNRYDVTAEISGGNERARYYTNLGYNSTGGLLNFGEGKNNDGNNRFNIRGNVDMNINSFLSATVDASAIFYTGRGVNTNYWSSAATLRPYRFSPLIPIDMIEPTDQASLQLVRNSDYLIDGKYLLGGTQLDQTNPFASIYAGGYNRFNNRQFQFNTGINADLKGITEGLSFHTLLGVDYANSYNQTYNANYAVYQPNWTNYAGRDMIGSLTKYGEDFKTGNQNISSSAYRQTISFSARFNYIKSIANAHNISAVLVGQGYKQTVSAQYQNIRNLNMGLQLGYNYKQKYYADFTGAMVHSARLPDNHRLAFSPTASLGWRISEESFLKGSRNVDDLKLTVSGGILSTDLDISDYYLYQSIYKQTDGSWYGWRDGTGIQSTDARRGDNLEMTFPKRKEITLGLQGSFFKRFITLDGSVFYNSTVGNLIQASVLYPNYFTTGFPNTSFIPYINYNNDQRVGFDLALNFNKRIGNVDWTLGTVATYYTTKASRRAEIYENAYQNRQDRPLDAIWGLQNDGFFMNQADIQNSAQQTFGQVKPGDIKYKDQNGDKIIDSRDEVYLGKGGWYGSPLTAGVNLTAKWKNFTFFALGTGRFGAYAMKNSSYFWVDGEDKYSIVVRDRWTEATKATAQYPRLTTLNSDNNFRSSDFWLYSTNRFDLTKVQIGYQLPERILKNKFMKEFNLYVSGFNLLTISGEREIMEMNVGGAPQTRFYNLGLKAMF
jgi:TonB-linked SusC/RagA family outer membrane protein